MADEIKDANINALTRQWALDKAIQIAEINHTAEINRILSDANRIFNFYQKGTLPE